MAGEGCTRGRRTCRVSRFGAIVVGETGFYLVTAGPPDFAVVAFHAVHHSAEELDWLVSSGASCGMVFLGYADWCRCTCWGWRSLWGFGGPGAGAGHAHGHGLGFFIHANVSWRFGWLERIVSSPAFHHWHHTNDGPECVNKNFAPMLPWIDQCFGTFYLPKGKWPSKYGTDAAVAPGIGAQLLDPVTGG